MKEVKIKIHMKTRKLSVQIGFDRFYVWQIDSLTVFNIFDRFPSFDCFDVVIALIILTNLIVLIALNFTALADLIVLRIIYPVVLLLECTSA